MVYPLTRQTFPVQNPDTIADNNFINDITDLLVALEDRIGLTDSSPTAGNIEGRIKHLEGGGRPRLFFTPTTPGGTPILGDLWVKTADEPWLQYYFNGSAWNLMGANAMMIGGKMVDADILPTNNQVPIYNSSVDRIQWATILTNPLQNDGEMIVSGPGGDPGALSPGADYDVLSINPSFHGPQWAPTPKFFDQLFLRQYMDFVLTPAPQLSHTGELRLYASSSPLGLYYSVNGGSYQAIGGGSGGGNLSALLDHMGSMLYSSDGSGTLTELLIGGEGAALVSIGGLPTWRTNAFIPSPTSTTAWSIIYFDGSTWTFLPPGTAGQFLRTQGIASPPAWTDLPSSSPGSGIVPPVGSTAGDILVHNGTDWIRLPAGTAGRFLQTIGTSGIPVWAALPPTLTNPMTTPGDTIYATIGGAPARLAGGVANNDRYMSIVAGVPAWVDSPASAGKTLWMAG